MHLNSDGPSLQFYFTRRDLRTNIFSIINEGILNRIKMNDFPKTPRPCRIRLFRISYVYELFLSSFLLSYWHIWSHMHLIECVKVLLNLNESHASMHIPYLNGYANSKNSLTLMVFLRNTWPLNLRRKYLSLFFFSIFT